MVGPSLCLSTPRDLMCSPCVEEFTRPPYKSHSVTHRLKWTRTPPMPPTVFAIALSFVKIFGGKCKFYMYVHVCVIYIIENKFYMIYILIKIFPLPSPPISSPLPSPSTTSHILSFSCQETNMPTKRTRIKFYKIKKPQRKTQETQNIKT